MNPLKRIASSLSAALNIARTINSGPSVDEIVEKLPSVLSFTERKRSMAIIRELQVSYGMELGIAATHLALETAVREGWAAKEIIEAPEELKRMRGGRPIVVYFKIGSGRRIKQEKAAPSTFGVGGEVTA